MFIPAQEQAGSPAVWVSTSDCVWASPVALSDRQYSLAKLYEDNWPGFAEDGAELRTFFCSDKALNIPSCTREDAVNEIRRCKASQITDTDKLHELYRYFGRMAASLDDRCLLDEMRYVPLSESFRFRAPN